MLKVKKRVQVQNIFIWIYTLSRNKLSPFIENKNIVISWAKFGLLNKNEWYIGKHYALRRDHNPG